MGLERVIVYLYTSAVSNLEGVRKRARLNIIPYLYCTGHLHKPPGIKRRMLMDILSTPLQLPNKYYDSLHLISHKLVVNLSQHHIFGPAFLLPTISTKNVPHKGKSFYPIPHSMYSS